MLIGGLLFRVGVVALVAAIAAPLVFMPLPFSQASAVLSAMVVVFAGVFVTATPASRLHLEIVGNDTSSITVAS